MDLEIFLGEYRDFITEFQGKTLLPQTVKVSGSAVRIIEKNRVGFHYANTPYDTKIQVEKASQSASMLDTPYEWPITFPGPQSYPQVCAICDPAIKNAEIGHVVDYCAEIVEELGAYEISARGMCCCRTSHFNLQNSEGLEAEEESTHFMLDMDVGRGENTYNVVIKSRLWDTDTESIVDAVRERFEWYDLEKREASKSSLALGTRAFHSVLHPFVWQASVDRVKRGISRITLNQSIAGESLTLFDDGTCPNRTGTSLCDGEGIASKKYCIVEKGMVQTFMYDHFHALLDTTESTGNAFRASMMAPPRIMPRNLVVKEGGFSLSEFTGILIDEFVSDRGADIVSGEYVFNVKKAFSVKKGEVLGAVDPFVLRGNVFTLLHHVCHVGTLEENPFPQHRELIAPYVFIQVPS